MTQNGFKLGPMTNLFIMADVYQKVYLFSDRFRGNKTAYNYKKMKFNKMNPISKLSLSYESIKKPLLRIKAD